MIAFLWYKSLMGELFSCLDVSSNQKHRRTSRGLIVRVFYIIIIPMSLRECDEQLIKINSI